MKSEKWYAAMHARKGKGTNQYTKAKELGLEKPEISLETREKFRKNQLGRKLSNDTKNKISKSMIQAHIEHRAWNIGMSRWNNQPSYPEIFFMKIIKQHFVDQSYIREYPIGIYSADFCWLHLKKVIEIDGDQHYRFIEYSERDKRKDKYLKLNNYKILRVSWKDFCNHTKDKIEECYKFIHSY